ncbi:permease prefix domain 1-containing protein [Clostridium sp.]|uniref:permease prefix domain 1-containing protein n=1 Tax=Clostridium sp. TaxID=1506 RepID=UPI003D6D138E
MNEIDRYVDSICDEFNESAKDIQIFREELKSSLYDEAHELEKQGLSEDESIKMALKSFGQENDVISEMSTVWKKKTDFTLLMVKVAISIFIIGLIFTGANMYYENSANSMLENISYLFFIVSWIIGTIAFYQYINIEHPSKILVFVAICDIAIGGYSVCTRMFPSQVEVSIIILFVSVLIIVLAMKSYFNKKRI